MFFPPKLKTIMKASTLAAIFVCGSATTLTAQMDQLQRRMAAMEQARHRANSGAVMDQPSSQMRVASVGSGVDRQLAPAHTRVASSTMPPNSRPVSHRMITEGRAMNSRPITHDYRTAQIFEDPIIDGGSPLIDSQDHYQDAGYYYEEPFASEFGSCGDSCGYFGFCDRGGCPDDFCWLSSFGQILYRGDYFFGAQGFQTPMFAAPGTNLPGLVEDQNFGFYGGFNFGLPLCRLTCGLFSGQFGIRSVQSNFGGARFTEESRDQMFMTAGFFRRVDYGFQAGAVADLFWENWFTNSHVVQLRAELSYLWLGGTSFGFRYHGNISDDVTSGTLGGVPVDGLRTFSEDQYRFFLRHETMVGGFGEAFIGWTDSEQTIFGFALDAPITNTLSAQTSVTYFLDDTRVPAGGPALGGYVNEAWNVTAGFAWRPAGRTWYRGYERPLFDVADNGSMLIRRQ